MTARPMQLPPLARRFVLSPEGKRVEPIVRRFCRWLEAKHIAISGLAADDLHGFFLLPFRRTVTQRTAWSYKRGLIGYLYWLHRGGWLSFDPKVLKIRWKRLLPPIAVLYLQSLATTCRPSTCAGRATVLRRFHEWLADARVEAKRLRRAQIEQWFLTLCDHRFHASTRRHALLDVRAYLRWRFDHGELAEDPDDLVRVSDLPRLPTYLPRPLSPRVDAELQHRLARSPHPLWLGLLLMRQTGLRIGELRSLEYDCIREDQAGNRFLKVPLGKLDNERLVPVTEATFEIVRSLQSLGHLSRRYLLEPVKGGKVPYEVLRQAFRRACERLEDPEPITTHRLRHTYATTLLNAGMSLVGVMKLLGHRDYRMTLRYAAITQETTGREYLEALANLQTRYADAALVPAPLGQFDPLKALSELIAWTKKRLADDDLRDEQLARSLTKRLLRIRTDLEPLT
jgi:site-specific recombinase XerD